MVTGFSATSLSNEGRAGLGIPVITQQGGERFFQFRHAGESQCNAPLLQDDTHRRLAPLFGSGGGGESRVYCTTHYAAELVTQLRLSHCD